MIQLPKTPKTLPTWCFIKNTHNLYKIQTNTFCQYKKQHVWPTYMRFELNNHVLQVHNHILYKVIAMRSQKVDFLPNL